MKNQPVIFFLILIFSLQVFGAKKNVKTKLKVKTAAVIGRRETKAVSQEAEWLLLSGLGIQYWKGLGFFSELGVGYSSGQKDNWLLGINNQLSLFSKGSLFSTGLGAWYRSRSLIENERGLLLGVFVSAAFPSGGIGEEQKTIFVPQLEASWVQPLEEFAAWKVSAKAAWVSNHLSAQASIGFLFDLN